MRRLYGERGFIFPALSLTNPWVLLAISVAITALMGWLLVKEHDRRIEFAAEVEAVGKHAEAERLRISGSRKQLSQEKQDEFTRRKTRLQEDRDGADQRVADLTKLLDDPSRSLIGRSSGTASGNQSVGDGVECFKADQLDRGIFEALRKFNGAVTRGTLDLLQRGDNATIIADVCSTWAVEQTKIK